MIKLLFKRKTDPQRELEQLLGDYDLPSFPAIVMTALEKIRDENTSLAEISDLVSADPGLTLRLLGTVNSAAFALRHKVRSIQHAISLLGRAQVESMLISVAVRQALPASPVRGFDSTRFWRAAARRAAAARALADRIDPSTRSESFTAALLQDMALPILSHAKPEQYGPLLEHWHESNDDLASLEQRELGWDHAIVAEWMSRTWKFPDRLGNAIGGHHQVSDDDPAGLPSVRLVASLKEIEERLGVEALIARAHEQFGLDEDALLELIQTSFDEARSLGVLLG